MAYNKDFSGIDNEIVYLSETEMNKNKIDAIYWFIVSQLIGIKDHNWNLS